MFHTTLCQFPDLSYSSSTDRALCECSNTKSSNLEFNESDGVEQGTVKLEEAKPSLWERILQESEDNMSAYKQWYEEKHFQETIPTFQDESIDYLNKEVFPFLLPALKDMLILARQWNALKVQKCRFNGLDFLAEKLWNENPQHPDRCTNWLDVFNIPTFKSYLKLNPRPIYPKSWILTKDEAAIIIQKYIRGWLVRKFDDVHETKHL